jgi:hypothetical protein
LSPIVVYGVCGDVDSNTARYEEALPPPFVISSKINLIYFVT